MSRDEFDLGDFGEEPSFPEDEAFLPPDTPPPGSGPRNMTFVILAVALVIIFLLGLGAIVVSILVNQPKDVAFIQTSTSIALTNQAVILQVTATAVASAWTKTPTPTDTFTPSPTDTPTITDTPTDTPTPTIDDTEVAGETQTSDANIVLTDSAMTALAAQGTSVATQTTLTDTPTTSSASLTPSLTPSGSETVTPIPVSTTATSTPAATLTFTPAQPTCAPGQSAKTDHCNLTQDGLFDDLAGGNAGPSSLALLGGMALVLVAVIFGARRLRTTR